MRSLPDIPGTEHPEYALTNEAAKATVRADIASLEVDLDIDRHPELLARLAEIGTHFNDSVAMAKMIRVIYGPLRSALDLPDEGPERLMRYAILHDIGKSGPLDASPELRDAVRQLFVNPPRPFNPFAGARQKTIGEFVAEEGLSRPDTLLRTLKDAGIDPEREPMLDFWRRHADWTYEILNKEFTDDADRESAEIAASHHLLDGKNPAHLDMAQVRPESHVLEVIELASLIAAVDKYQAFRVRAHLGHAETVRRLREFVSADRPVPPELRERFNAVIDILERSAEDLNAIASEG